MLKIEITGIAKIITMESRKFNNGFELIFIFHSLVSPVIYYIQIIIFNKKPTHVFIFDKHTYTKIRPLKMLDNY